MYAVPLVPTRLEAGWAPEPVLTAQTNEKISALLEIDPCFLHHPACSVVTIVTDLFQLTSKQQQ